MSKALRVLLVEDNPGDADLTKETLEASRRPVEVSTVINGADAIAYLLSAAAHGGDLPDLILLDLNLPKVDGLQVLEKIKSHRVLSRIPVIVLTSSDAEQDIVKSYELGANCYVTKPVGLEAFQSIMRSMENFWLMVVKLP